MKEYIIGLGVFIAFVLIVYVIILLIKAISRGISSCSKIPHSHRPIAIIAISIFGLLASLVNLGLGLFAVFHWDFDTDIMVFVGIPILVGVLGSLCSIALFL